MERRYQVRLQELLDDAVVEPEQCDGMLSRLEQFVEPFAACLVRSKQRTLARQYVAGLASQMKCKNVESIAYHHDQDRQMLQKFIGQYTWDHRPLVGELVRQVGAALGRADAVLVFDPSAFPKREPSRSASSGNGVGDWERSTTAKWACLWRMSRRRNRCWSICDCTCQKVGPAPKRCGKAGVPAEVKFRTRHKFSLEMLDEHADALPHGWMAGDDEMGKVAEFRGEIAARNERYLLAVPSNTLVRDLEAEPPVYAGRGRHPKSPWQRVDKWCDARPRGLGPRSTCGTAKRGRLPSRQRRFSFVPRWRPARATMKLWS